jgi:hypothetical protein
LRVGAFCKGSASNCNGAVVGLYAFASERERTLERGVGFLSDLRWVSAWGFGLGNGEAGGNVWQGTLGFVRSGGWCTSISSFGCSAWRAFSFFHLEPNLVRSCLIRLGSVKFSFSFYFTFWFWFFYREICILVSLFLRTFIKKFTQVIFTNIITYLGRTFKEE